MRITLTTFAPPPEMIDQVLHDLGDPEESIGSVAAAHGTTIEALSIWMARPDVSSRLIAQETAMSRRIRLSAMDVLPAAIHSLHHICLQYIGEEVKIPARPGDLQSHEFHRRARETARRASALLARLARFDPVLPRPRKEAGVSGPNVQQELPQESPVGAASPALPPGEIHPSPVVIPPSAAPIYTLAEAGSRPETAPEATANASAEAPEAGISFGAPAPPASESQPKPPESVVVSLPQVTHRWTGTRLASYRAPVTPPTSPVNHSGATPAEMCQRGLDHSHLPANTIAKPP